jgi:hypothetical protein
LVAAQPLQSLIAIFKNQLENTGGLWPPVFFLFAAGYSLSGEGTLSGDFNFSGVIGFNSFAGDSFSVAGSGSGWAGSRMAGGQAGWPGGQVRQQVG